MVVVGGGVRRQGARWVSSRVSVLHARVCQSCRGMPAKPNCMHMQAELGGARILCILHVHACVRAARHGMPQPRARPYTLPPSLPLPPAAPPSPARTCSTRVKHLRWWSVGSPMCMVRVMSVVPHSYWPPLSSSSSVEPSTTRHVPGWALAHHTTPHAGICTAIPCPLNSEHTAALTTACIACLPACLW